MNIIIVRSDIAQQRYDVCKGCADFTALKLCRYCNCFMPVKVKFALADCPKGKWVMTTNPQEHQHDAYKDLE
jgi:hypothetical protein